jgi:hypothetical protein
LQRGDALVLARILRGRDGERLAGPVERGCGIADLLVEDQQSVLVLDRLGGAGGLPAHQRDECLDHRSILGYEQRSQVRL